MRAPLRTDSLRRRRLAENICRSCSGFSPGAS